MKENKTINLLEQYKQKIELAKEISKLTQAEQQILFNQDWQEVIDNLKGFEKATQGHGYKYADLTEIHKVIREAIKNKFTFMHLETDTNLITTIIHSITNIKILTQTRKPEIADLKSLNSRVNFVQAMGSWQTYIKRYHLMALFALAEEDDDAEALTPKEKGKTTFAPPPAKIIDPQTQQDMNYLIDMISQGLIKDIQHLEKTINDNAMVKNKNLAKPINLEKFKKYFEKPLDN